MVNYNAGLSEAKAVPYQFKCIIFHVHSSQLDPEDEIKNLDSTTRVEALRIFEKYSRIMVTKGSAKILCSRKPTGHLNSEASPSTLNPK